MDDEERFTQSQSGKERVFESAVQAEIPPWRNQESRLWRER